MATFRVIGSPGYPLDEDWLRAYARRAFARGLAAGADAGSPRRQLAAAMASPSRLTGLRGLRVPTLVVHGEDDPLIRPAAGRATARAVQGARLLVFPGMGHNLPAALWPALVRGGAGVRRPCRAEWPARPGWTAGFRRDRDCPACREEPMPEPYLVGLDLAGRRVVVVGGGSVAQRRLVGLLAAGAVMEVIAPEVTPAVEAMAAELTWTARPYRDGDLDGAWYAIACTDDPAVNAAVVEEAERARIFCVRADDAPEGSAVTPASFGTRAVGRRAGRRRAPALGRDALGDSRGACSRDSSTGARRASCTAASPSSAAGPGTRS